MIDFRMIHMVLMLHSVIFQNLNMVNLKDKLKKIKLILQVITK